MIPPVQMPMKSASNLGFTAFRNMISEGRDSVVTAIIKLRTVPSCAPLESSASATGIVPKMSAYIGTPIIAARTTPKGLPLPKTASTQCSGIQLWMTAPIPTPTRM